MAAVAAGPYYSMVLKKDGSVWAMGANQYGQLGVKSRPSSTRLLLAGRGMKAVAAGGEHSMALKQDGSVWVTGRNNNGQLGDGTSTSRH